MLAHLLILSFSLALSAPGADQPQDQPDHADQGFGELEATPKADEPRGSASGGYGALAPLPNYEDEGSGDEGGGPSENFGEIEAAPADSRGRKQNEQEPRFEEPEDFGPFYEASPVSEVEFPGDAYRPDRKQPFASVAGGTFCFVEDSMCAASLLADADVGVGLNVITSDRGLNVPYTQLRVRGGFTLRPLELAKRRWHPWGVGVVASWSLGSGSITATNRDPSDANTGIVETNPIRSWRIAVVNQIWLAQKRNALHLDFTLGTVNSSVLDAQGRYWGTHAEVALGFGGWGGLYFAGDFLDADSRVFMGVRGHGIATGPLIALIVLGLVAGGVAL